jgi:hopanoid-associated phosphorylase
MHASTLPLLVFSGLDFEARIAAGKGVVTICGTGSVAWDRLEYEAAQGCCGILSFGTAGGLAPALTPGDCVLAEIITHDQQSWNVDPAWLNALHAMLPEARRGMIIGVDNPVSSSESKQLLWRESSALAVDMESHKAAQAAQRHGVPFAVCRIIVDPAQRALPTSATVGLRPDGSIAILPILRALAMHPGELVSLCGLAREARLARKTLVRIRTRLDTRFAFPIGRAG